MFSVLQEEGFEASEKQRYKTARKKTESDDNCKVTCTEGNKLDDTDHVRRGQTKKTTKSSLATKERERHDQHRIQ